MSDRPIRAIIVDDEELARRGIEIRLAAHTDVEIVGHCENGREALEAIAREKPDLMFLDIQMPGMSGFDVLARLPHDALPMIVFVTAFDRFALDAFEAQALDYLLKPINDTRFTQALERVRSFWRQRSAIAQRDKLMQLIAATKGSGSLDEEELRSSSLRRSGRSIRRCCRFGMTAGRCDSMWRGSIGSTRPAITCACMRMGGRMC